MDRFAIIQLHHVLRGQKIHKLQQIAAVGRNGVHRHTFCFGYIIQKLYALCFYHKPLIDGGQHLQLNADGCRQAVDL